MLGIKFLESVCEVDGDEDDWTSSNLPHANANE
jgi:hypothetical protein